jgi:hypothetical protein
MQQYSNGHLICWLHAAAADANLGQFVMVRDEGVTKDGLVRMRTAVSGVTSIVVETKDGAEVCTEAMRGHPLVTTEPSERVIGGYKLS